jgi:hypothetical protein
MEKVSPIRLTPPKKILSRADKPEMNLDADEPGKLHK